MDLRIPLVEPFGRSDFVETLDEIGAQDELKPLP